MGKEMNDVELEGLLDDAIAGMTPEAWKADLKHRKDAIRERLAVTGKYTPEIDTLFQNIYKEIEQFEETHGYIGFC